jgi:formyltetrahydrofolate hydrolase
MERLRVQSSALKPVSRRQQKHADVPSSKSETYPKLRKVTRRDEDPTPTSSSTASNLPNADRKRCVFGRAANGSHPVRSGKAPTIDGNLIKPTLLKIETNSDKNVSNFDKTSNSASWIKQSLRKPDKFENARKFTPTIKKGSETSDVLQNIRFGHGENDGSLELSGKGVNETLVDQLCTNLKNIRHITLLNNNLSEKAQMKLITAVIDANTIATLVLDGIEISEKNCDCIGNIFKANRTLTTFSVPLAKLPSKLESRLKRNRKIESYVKTIRQAGGMVQSRAITPRDNELVVNIVKIIGNDPSITEFVVDGDVRFQHLGSSMILDLAESLRSNYCLKTLRVTNVELGNAFLSALATSITTNFTLEEIDLSGNAITSEAVVAFCQAMPLNTTLIRVDLSRMHTPILSDDEGVVLKALKKNESVRQFQIKFRNGYSKIALEKILARNKSAKCTPAVTSFDTKLLAYLKAEAEQAETILSERQQTETDGSEQLVEDWAHLYELSKMADIFNSFDNAYEECGETTEQPTTTKKKSGKISLVDVIGSMESMSADGSFLTEAFISKYMVENKETGGLVFEFTNQFQMFKRFQIGDKARGFITKRFVDVLLAHPRTKEITHLNMANINCSDDLLEWLSKRCKTEATLLPKLHMLNLETNNISGSGVVALAETLKTSKTWRFLQAIKLENQSSLMKTEAEAALAKAMFVNCSVIRLGLRLRNLLERDRIGRYLQRNMDYLRRARREHAAKTGKIVKRSRNTMERFIDSIAANDSAIDHVEIVGDPLFLGLNRNEVLNAAKCFASNTFVMRVKLCNLKLDDKYAEELAKSLEQSRIEYLCLDSNAIGGNGIKAIVASLAKNRSVVELQIRHQTKNMAAADEEVIADLLDSNESLVKMGIDFRSHSARTKLERKLANNNAIQRKARTTDKQDSKMTSSISKIKSVEVQKLFDSVKDGNPSITEIELNNIAEFLQMEKRSRQNFYESLRENKTVKSLSLCNLQLDNTFADELVIILSVNETIRTIVLNDNEFTSAGILTIALAAAKRRNVRQLSIRNPRFKLINEHAEELLLVMERKSNFETFDIQLREETHKQRLFKILAKNSRCTDV